MGYDRQNNQRSNLLVLLFEWREQLISTKQNDFDEKHENWNINWNQDAIEIRYKDCVLAFCNSDYNQIAENLASENQLPISRLKESISYKLFPCYNG